VIHALALLHRSLTRAFNQNIQTLLSDCRALDSMPFFSVIVPTFNRVELLKSAVDSILAQRYADFELIIVDDGSRDKTLEYLRALGVKATVLRQSNQGPGSARNRGARIATGKYLAFLDSDDVWFPWTLEVYREAIGRYTSTAFLTGKPYVFSEDKDLELVKGEVLKVERFEDYLSSGDQWRWWGVSSFVIHTEMFIGVGGFLEDRVNSEDADLALRLGVAPGFVQITSPATFAYRVHAANVKDDLERTLAGIRCALNAENGERYPGGRARARERREILTRHMRPVALECLREGNWREAWRLYVSTFAWNLSLGRFRYLVGFPLFAVMESGRRMLAALGSRRPC
jgi:glycosyltransferase involved in cell wall biosynthesis